MKKEEELVAMALAWGEVAIQRIENHVLAGELDIEDSIKITGPVRKGMDVLLAAFEKKHDEE